MHMSHRLYINSNFLDFEFSFAGCIDYTVGHAEDKDKYY